MARFYQTSPRNYQDDFIFQPDWDLAKAALQKKDADIQEQVETLSLLDSLPIESWQEADAENANQIRDEYGSKVDEIASRMQNNLMDITGNRRLLKDLQKEIEREYETGRIRQIQDNAAAYKQFTERLNQLDNPTDREAWKKAIQNYLNTNEQGAWSSIFTPPEVYETEDWFEDYAGSDIFKNMEADVVDKTFDYTRNDWLFTTTTGEKIFAKDKIKEGFKAYIESNPNIMGRAMAGAEYFGENNWFDEDGNLDFEPGSVLGNMLEHGAEALQYRAKKSSTTREVDQIAKEKRERQEAQRVADNAAMDNIIGTTVDAAGAYRNSEEIRNYEREYLKNYYRDMLGGTHTAGGLRDEDIDDMMFKDNVYSLQDFIDKYKKDYPLITAKVERDLAVLKGRMKASYMKIIDAGASPQYIENFQKSFIKNFNDYKGSLKYNLLDEFDVATDHYNETLEDEAGNIVKRKSSNGTWESIGSDGNWVKDPTNGSKRHKGKDLKEGSYHSISRVNDLKPPELRGRRPEEFVGQKIKVNGVEYTIEEVSVIDSTPIPVLLNGTFKTNDGGSIVEGNGDINDNIATTMIRIYYGKKNDEEKYTQYVDKRASFSMKEIGIY